MDEVEEVLPRPLTERYRLDSKLGEGGMGTVYQGLDLVMRRLVAVKLVRPEEGTQISEEIAGRFLREAKHTARLRHEHIVEVFDVGRTDNGELFLVMELLAGESLSDLIRRDHRLHYRAVIHIALQICEGLHVAHSSGIVHRDLKPGNIMLVPRAGDDFFVKVLDFGVAKSNALDQTQLTRTGVLVGTVEYMAPEQILGGTIDARTDVYAFGALLYRALTGTHVFREQGVPKLINHHLNKAPESLASRAPDVEVPAALEAVVMKCLAKKPEDRYESMRELWLALAGVLEPAEVEEVVSSGRIEAAAAFDDVSTITKPLALESGPGAALSDSGPLPSFDDVTELETDAHRETRNCFQCGTPNPGYLKTCATCGNSLATVQTSHPPYAASSIPPPIVPYPEPAPILQIAQTLKSAGPYDQPPAPPTTMQRVESYAEHAKLVLIALWRRLLAWIDSLKKRG